MSILFRKRRAIVRRLLKHRVSNETPRPLETLTMEQLEHLAVSIETQGAEDAPCVLLSATEEPHLSLLKLWRWPDVRCSEIKKLPNCSLHEPWPRCGQVCCNPYHWSRLYKPDTSLPSYSKNPVEKLDESSVCYTSQITGCSESSRPWCKLAYWELNNRVGRLFPVSQPSIDIFSDLPQGDGLCLQTLSDSSPSDNTSILHTRSKIGCGITVFRESDEAWIYNRSAYPIFVNSPTLDPPNTLPLTVYKVLPGYCIKIFDFERARYNQRMTDPSLLRQGPVDNFAVHISFVKGWGSKYSRRCILSCPCWLEIMFLVNR